MSLRSVVIVSISKEEFGEPIFYRTFPTVEKRCRSLHGSEYVPLPSPQIFVNNLLIKLGLSVSSKQFVEWRDKASSIMQLPVVEVKIGDQELWPIVSIIQHSIVVCCLPFVEDLKKEERDNLLQMPSISVSFSVLLGILNFFRIKSKQERVSQLQELDNFFTVCMPFGTPTDTGPSWLALLNAPHSHSYTKKQPAWKPADYKGKQTIYLKVSEFVRSMQTEESTSHEIFGQISVKAELEGTQNDVTLCITSSKSSSPLALDSILVHPCVQMHGAGANASNLLRRLRFTPPLHEIILLQYCSPDPGKPPIHGVFKMLDGDAVELLIQLKLTDNVKNNFDYFDVIVVFFNRGPVKSFEYNTNHGMLKLSDDKHSIKWNIGTKFPKEMEVAVTVKLEFLDEPVLPHSDPFCVDKNCYAQVNFKLSNTTLSGCNIDTKSVIVSQAIKPKIALERSVESTEYRLWNNYGELPFPVNIEKKFSKLLVI